MSSLRKPSVDWFFLLQWVLATIIGSIIGLSGIVSGILQWLVLRQRITNAGWWILATIVGNSLTSWGIGFVGLALAGLAEGGGGSPNRDTFVFIVAVGSGGVFIGILQWLVLRRYVFQAGRWILVSMLSFTLSWFLVYFGQQAAFSIFSQSTASIVPRVVAGLVSGVMTGIVLVWLLQHPRPQAQFITTGAHNAMKSKRLLIGLAIGAVLIVVVPLIVPGLLNIVFGWSSVNINSEYVADNSAEGVVHNYWLAIQRKDYEKAYNYLSDDIESKPDFDHFVAEVDFFSGDRRNSMKIKEIRLKEDGLAEIDSLIQTYTSVGFSTGGDTIYLQLENDGNGWKILDFTNPYWNHEWNR